MDVPELINNGEKIDVQVYPASVPGLLGRYTDEYLQRVTKLALELLVKGQEHDQLQASSVPRE